MHKFAYLRDPWNWLDFVVVILGLVPHYVVFNNIGLLIKYIYDLQSCDTVCTSLLSNEEAFRVISLPSSP